MSGITEKNLALIPQRIAIAAQEDGWIVRSDIKVPTWMPESAKDRPTDAYRTVLMLTKSNKPTFWWNEKTMIHQGKPGLGTSGVEGVDWDYVLEDDGSIVLDRRGRPKKRSYWHGKDYWFDGFAVRVPSVTNDGRRPYMSPGAKLLNGRPTEQWHGGELREIGDSTFRSLGNVWDDIPPSNYPDKHFATFSIAEPERCIKASCPPEICVKCGKARVRVVGREKPHSSSDRRDVYEEYIVDRGEAEHGVFTHGHSHATTKMQSIGWTDCGCGASWTPGVTLDPFAGTGTTLIAARKLGRRAIGIEISEEYIRQASRRLELGDKGIRQQVSARRKGAEQLAMEEEP